MPDLLLIPTTFERDLIASAIRRQLAMTPPVSGRSRWELEICGFGLVAAGIATANAIARHRPDRVLLLGIAGSYGEKLAVGTACVFDRVICHGIGVGNDGDDSYRSAGELGWQQCEASAAQPAIGDCIDLTYAPAGASSDTLAAPEPRHLLSVTAASANLAEANQRRQRVPTALAEDMEGYAVAMACRLANVPLVVIRGISNRVGDRDHSGWQVEAALNSATKLATDRFGVTLDP
ncbi:MAG: futalosine hydrolase [Planctomycetaceae bacterium]